MSTKNGLNLYLKPEETRFICLAVVILLENATKAASNPAFPFNPEARKTLKEIIEAGKAVRAKLSKLGIDMSDLDDVDDDELLTYLTKES